MNILTFDLEDWFHILDNASTRSPAEWEAFPSRVEENTDRILNLLSDRGITATFFCLGWIAERHPDIVKKIAALGHDVGSHSYEHQLVYEQSPDAFREDVRRSVSILEDITGKKVRMYRAPGFSIGKETAWAFETLCNAGIEIDASIFPTGRAHGGFDGFARRPVWIEYQGLRLKEFPINLGRVFGKRFVFSGGGYFRLVPYWALQRLMSGADYVMTYFHPRDFDSGQPVIADLPRVRKFKSYCGLASAFGKLERLLDEFRFVSLGEADKLIDWERTPVVEIQVDGGMLHRSRPATVS